MEYYVSILNFQFWLRLQMSRKPHYLTYHCVFCLLNCILYILQIFTQTFYIGNIYIYAFSRRFYPKRLTSAFRLYIFCQSLGLSQSLGIEPTTFALLTQCSTTEPQELMTTMNNETMTWTRSHFCPCIVPHLSCVSEKQWHSNSSLINCLFEDERGCVLIWNQKELLNLHRPVNIYSQYYLWN